MSEQYRLFQRASGIFYGESRVTGEQFSLHTRGESEARQLLHARNESHRVPHLNLELARTYLSGVDPRLVTRTWDEVLTHMVAEGAPGSKSRRLRCWDSDPFQRLHHRRLFETVPDEFARILKTRSVFAFNFLRCLHNRALTLGWLKWPIVNHDFWKSHRPKSRPKRGITWEEHQRILTAEQNPERRLYYDLLWETGAGQTDGANLTSEAIDWNTRILSFVRRKTGQLAQLAIGSRLEAILRQRPDQGLLFPAIAALADKDRAAEFRRRLRLLKLDGISLHSYRYGWAERACELGYPERWAQIALGHSSKAVHRAYARGAQLKCVPPLEGFAPRVVVASSEEQAAAA